MFRSCAPKIIALTLIYALYSAARVSCILHAYNVRIAQPECPLPRSDDLPPVLPRTFSSFAARKLMRSRAKRNSIDRICSCFPRTLLDVSHSHSIEISGCCFLETYFLSIFLLPCLLYIRCLSFVGAIFGACRYMVESSGL